MDSISQEELDTYDPCYRFLFQSPSHEKMEAFDNWLRRVGGYGIYCHPSVCYVYRPKKGYGIAAKSLYDLKAGKTIYRIPRDLVLDISSCSNQELAGCLREGGFDDAVGLTLVFLYECSKEKSSYHYEYLQTFRVPDVPRFWSDEEKEALEGCEIDIHGDTTIVYPPFSMTDYQYDIDLVFHTYVDRFLQNFGHKFKPPFKPFPLAVWQRAFVAVTSRCFQLDELRGLALVPIADMYISPTSDLMQLQSQPRRRGTH
jgi:hypothetical protein